MDGYEKTEHYDEESLNKISLDYLDILKELGEQPNREGLLKTPLRAAKAMQYLTHGYDLDPSAILRSAMFKEEYKQMVIVKDIEVYSLCEHLLLPFFG
jgi:GTP cyclohydrolase I